MKMLRAAVVLLLAGCGVTEVGSRYVTSKDVKAGEAAVISVDATQSAQLAGLRLELPAGAINQNVTVQVELSMDDAVNAVGPAVIFNPQALVLAQPATLTLPIYGLSTDQSADVLVIASDGSTSVIPADRVSINAARTFATFSISHFGSYQARSLAGGPSCTPSSEICNGIDDDCDGVVDDDCVVDDGGVDGGPYCAANLDDAGMWDPDAGSYWMPCDGGVDLPDGGPNCALPVAEICGNGIDDDCNGIVDENCVWDAGQANECNTDADCGIGACVQGQCVFISDSGCDYCDAGTWDPDGGSWTPDGGWDLDGGAWDPDAGADQDAG